MSDLSTIYTMTPIRIQKMQRFIQMFDRAIRAASPRSVTDVERLDRSSDDTAVGAGAVSREFWREIAEIQERRDVIRRQLSDLDRHLTRLGDEIDQSIHEIEQLIREIDDAAARLSAPPEEAKSEEEA